MTHIPLAMLRFPPYCLQAIDSQDISAARELI
jgi:hypothetical protein